MSIQVLIDDYEKMVKQLSQQVGMSGASYNQKDIDLKQHLANHNVLIGELNGAKKALEALKKANEPAKPEVPPVPPVPPVEEPEAE